ncbi:hypothetical protein PINS_up019036 [Pythium insidiosum]|nr:hypothetical protein PINS_up019036 [Pythium insidiosum]
MQVMSFITPNDQWTLVARARLLAVAFNIVNSIERVTEMVAPDGELQRVFQFSQTPPSPRDKGLRRPLECSRRLESLVNVLVTVAQSLFQDDFLLQARDRMQELARQNAAVDTAYEHALRLVERRVDDATAACLDNNDRRSRGLHEDDEGPPHYCRSLAALLRSYEDEIQAASWWQDGSWVYAGEPDQSGSALPYLAFFRDCYEAVCASLMFSPLSMPPPSVSAVGLSGVWRLVNADRDIPAAASHDAGHPAYPFSWFQQQLQGFISQIYCIVETDTKMTLTLGNSLVSSACPFFAELDHRDPLIEVPRDHFPYGCDRRNLLVAYKARRLRAIQDKSGSCVSVCSMRWPAARVSGVSSAPKRRSPRWAAMVSDTEDGADAEDDGVGIGTGVGVGDGDGDGNGDEDVDDGGHEDIDEDDVEMGGGGMEAPPRRLLRTRMTSTFSLLSLDRLQVNTIIEGSWTESARLCAMTTTRPNAADMVDFYNTPGTWELMAKVVMQFDRIS